MCLLAWAQGRGVSLLELVDAEMSRVLSKPIEHFRKRQAEKCALGVSARFETQPSPGPMLAVRDVIGDALSKVGDPQPLVIETKVNAVMAALKRAGMTVVSGTVELPGPSIADLKLEPGAYGLHIEEDGSIAIHESYSGPLVKSWPAGGK